MRTKSRAVPRPRGEPMLEDDVSVSASRDLDSVRCPTLEGFQQASMVVNGLDAYADSISQRVITGVDVAPMSDRPPNGISIREPETGHTMVPDGLLDVPVTGKGKRKVNDVRLYEVEGSCTMDADASSSFLSDQSNEQAPEQQPMLYG
ncbi:hypothetical protein CTI12_AA426120 [Artemisia annua]|uniref:Uncharacterized protein n=1 Tax=Artemisia annua TaxID=35608 RepID=A0A2U1M2N9_ARTAN|nr:hypothetical protein CTI12_AA426120 [Artemisia annua]